MGEYELIESVVDALALCWTQLEQRSELLIGTLVFLEEALQPLLEGNQLPELMLKAQAVALQATCISRARPQAHALLELLRQGQSGGIDYYQLLPLFDNNFYLY